MDKLERSWPSCRLWFSFWAHTKVLVMHSKLAKQYFLLFGFFFFWSLSLVKKNPQTPQKLCYFLHDMMQDSHYSTAGGTDGHNTS